ncbi:MAG: hypothetical protein ACRDZ4_01730 [Egibacteraceae bacterium]
MGRRLLPATDQLRIRIIDSPAVIDYPACTPELAARLLERWPEAMIVFDQPADGRQGWLCLPTFEERGATRAAAG